MNTPITVVNNTNMIHKFDALCPFLFDVFLVCNGRATRSHVDSMVALAPGQAPLPCRRYWAGVHEPKKVAKASFGSVSSIRAEMKIVLNVKI